MEKTHIEYAAKTPFTEDRSANAASLIPAHIAAQLDRMNAETRSEDEDEELPVVPRVLRYRL